MPASRVRPGRFATVRLLPLLHSTSVVYRIDLLPSLMEMTVIVEYIRYTVPESAAAGFEEAYRAAAGVLTADSHCLGYELTRGIEEPEHFVVRIEWDSLDGHEQGFRNSPRFREFFADVQPFLQDIDEMKHYAVRQGQLTH